MAPIDAPVDFGDQRTHRVYEGHVVGGNAPLEPNGQLDLDHGYEDSPAGQRTHVWTDSSCWLKDLVGKRVRITIEVLPEPGETGGDGG